MKLLLILFVALTSSTALAQSEDRTKTQSADQKRNEIVKRFDKDKDGTLSAEEAAIARSTLAREKKTQPQPQDYRLAFAIKNPKEFKLDVSKEVFPVHKRERRYPNLRSPP